MVSIYRGGPLDVRKLMNSDYQGDIIFVSEGIKDRAFKNGFDFKKFSERNPNSEVKYLNERGNEVTLLSPSTEVCGIECTYSHRILQSEALERTSDMMQHINPIANGTDGSFRYDTPLTPDECYTGPIVKDVSKVQMLKLERKMTFLEWVKADKKSKWNELLEYVKNTKVEWVKPLY